MIYIVIFVTSYFGVEGFRRWSISKNILDIPNERSSHKTPTPRGGGLVIVFITLITLAIYQIILEQEIIWSYFVGAVLISLISWLDDLYTLPAIWRFLIQIIAASLIILQFGGFSSFYIPIIGMVNLSFFSIILIIVWIVWFTNAYNFMDGIDGIAGIQALTTSIGWVILGLFFKIEIYQFFGLVIFFTTLGFLLHNWYPAKIFMGDVGSAFLGFSFAVFPFISKIDLDSIVVEKYLIFIAMVFVWFFLFDTVVTFIKRALKKEKVWKAHRSHIYQRLVILGYKHSSISALYGLLSGLEILTVIYCLVLNKYEIVFVCLTLMITATLLLFVFNIKLLTNDV